MKNLLDDDDHDLRALLRRAAADVPPGPSAEELLHRLEQGETQPRPATRRLAAYGFVAGVAAAAVLGVVLAEGPEDGGARSVVAADPGGDAVTQDGMTGASFPATVDASQCPANVQAAFDGLSFAFSELTRLDSAGGGEEYGGMEYHPSSGTLTVRSTRGDATGFSGGPQQQTLIDSETGEPIGEGENPFVLVLLSYEIAAGASLELPVGPPVGKVPPGEYGVRVIYSVLTTEDETQPTFCEVVVEAEKVVLR